MWFKLFVVVFISALAIGCSQPKSSTESANFEQEPPSDSSSTIRIVVDTVPLVVKIKGLGLDKPPQWDTIWRSNGISHYLFYTLVNRLEDQFGSVTFGYTNNQAVLKTHTWKYHDSLYCDWQDIVVYSEWLHPIIMDADDNGTEDIVFPYSLDCTTDISPSGRTMIYYNASTGKVVKLSGWTLDPISPFPPKAKDLLFVKDTFLERQMPLYFAGRLKNNNSYKQLSSIEKKHIHAVWLQTNVRDSIESLGN